MQRTQRIEGPYLKAFLVAYEKIEPFLKHEKRSIEEYSIEISEDRDRYMVRFLLTHHAKGQQPPKNLEGLYPPWEMHLYISKGDFRPLPVLKNKT